MTKQKKILSYCPYFTEIVNCDFLEDDILTKKLIQYYQDFIFNIDEEREEEIELIKNLDKAMYKYIDDYRFAKKLRETLDIDTVIAKNFSYLEQLMKYIIDFFLHYEEEEVCNIVHTKWI
ncbi:MAG: hypothetical protein PHY26_00855 [Bacilli bacterium]|jgi:hypothetical protein|nr:hypothetical protein [Bacilli bacterium]